MTAIEKFIKFIGGRFTTTEEIFRAIFGDSTTSADNPDEYSTGTDGNLDNPTDVSGHDSTGSFVPVLNNWTGNETCFVYVGNYIWASVTIGDNEPLYGQDIGVNYGVVLLSTGSVSYNWNQFLSATYNGLKRIYLPKGGANNDGGYFDFYYDRDLWYNAFYGNYSHIVITQDGSVYKGSVSSANLVVNAEGRTTTNILTSSNFNEGAICNELDWLRGLVDQTVLSTDIDNTSSLEINIGWEDILGIEKQLFEDVLFYARRCKKIINGEKHTVYAIEQMLLMFTDEVTILEAAVDCGYVAVSYLNNPNHFTTPNFVRGATIGGSNSYTLRIFVKDNALLSSAAVRRTMMQMLEHFILPGVLYTVELV